MNVFKLGVVMDPISRIKIQKDSTFAMMLEAQSRGWQLYYMELEDLYLDNGRCMATMQQVSVIDDDKHWFQLQTKTVEPVAKLDAVLMRKDPPFDMQYIYATYLLELAQHQGALVVNNPASIRDANEKLFTAWFPQCTAPSIVSCRMSQLHHFIDEQGDTIIKPLDGMGGASIFRVHHADPNRNVILETMTQNQTRYVMAQRFIPEITQGDKRILMVNGEPIAYALARIPAQGETRGNLAAGGRAQGVELSRRDRWICQQVGATLVQKGLMFTGLDVIGDYLTEINVTSPTCIRELDALYGLNISSTLLDAIAQAVQSQPHKG
ncbi:MAG: glutathione synthase [Gammaproteobacteria bacterium]|nr:glutathione synthase [Gammaproteobacteria bacterium]MDH5802105.1 glutathione synthase [Gammaproteobacteria bacterium]